MARERDPRVVKIAEKLAMAQPYGFEYVKSGPSAADYHAALLAVKVIDEDVEYEYNIEAHDLDRDKRRVDGFWVDDPAKLDLGLENLRKHQQNYVDYGGYVHVEYKIVKRRKQAYEDA